MPASASELLGEAAHSIDDAQPTPVIGGRIWRASPDGRSCTQVAHLVKIWYVCGMPTRDRVSATASTAQRRATMLAGPPCALRSHYGSLAHARRMSECVRRERMTFSLETRRSVRL